LQGTPKEMKPESESQDLNLQDFLPPSGEKEAVYTISILIQIAKLNFELCLKR
jgi:hypothetical protein